ncbi:MAG TPA: trypsin-like peptidase domain-containing protein [Cytophagaceae bacterium]|jgi:Do/DeqQ family serine protease
MEKKDLKTLVIALLAGFSGAFIYKHVDGEKPNLFISNQNAPQVTSANYTAPSEKLSEDFVQASAISTQCVVFINTVATTNSSYNMFDWFFGGQQQNNQVVGSGSGVIYSQDGYIMTNNHVIEKAEVIEVVYNKRTYKAKVVGRDLNTDLAVLKIDATQLPAVKFANSNNVKIGEWVLAVGNPFNLNSTVTAGIVSAKARNINVVNSQFPLESFIQTDAAINPGNSGGALVNVKGELVGINTAILSRTGSYTGYGFAVPSDIVSKVVKDLIKYGEVQKAFTGVEVSEITSAVAEKLKLSDFSGVVVTYIQNQGAAEKAGLKKNDIILKLNDLEVNSKSTFEEYLSYYNPGDKVKIQYKSGNDIKDATLVLTNREGTTEILKHETFTSPTLGAVMETVSKVEKDKLGITAGGVRILKINQGLIRRLGISEGFIVTSINKVAINSPEEFADIVEKIRGKVVIEGITSNGVKGYYSFYF